MVKVMFYVKWFISKRIISPLQNVLLFFHCRHQILSNMLCDRFDKYHNYWMGVSRHIYRVYSWEKYIF